MKVATIETNKGTIRLELFADRDAQNRGEF